MRLLVLVFALAIPQATADEPDFDFWTHKAQAAAEEIGTPKVADRAFAQLHLIHSENDRFAVAIEITQRIQTPHLRVKAHLANAQHYAHIGEEEKCVEQLKQAGHFANNSILRDSLVEAYLDFAKSPLLATLFALDQREKSQARIAELCQALAKHGHLSEAMDLADSEGAPAANATLKLKIATASAKAALVEETERAVARVAMKRADAYHKQGVWMELARALYQNKDFAGAQKYAARVTDKYQLRRNRRILRHIEEATNLEKTPEPKGPPLNLTTMANLSPEFSDAIKEKDADRAAEIVASALAAAEANPQKPTSGQFGPSNQKTRLALIRIAYANVALAYHVLGERDQSLKNMRIAEDAIFVLQKENAFFAQLSAMGLHQIQIAIDDIEGLKRTTSTLRPEIWINTADEITAYLLSNGHVDAAKAVAIRALSIDEDHAMSQLAVAPTLVSCFVTAGDTDTALSLIHATKPTSYGARACEKAGQALIETDHEKLLLDWLQQLPAEWRAHLCIGAAAVSQKD